MLTHLLFAALPVMIALAVQGQAQTDPNYIVNGSFKEGLDGWAHSGNVHLETPIEGAPSVRFGPKKAEISQRYTVSGLRIMEFGATARFASADTTAMVRVRCLDKNGRILMDIKQPFDSKKALNPKGTGAGIYFKTHAFTSSIEVSIEKDPKSVDAVFVNSVELHDYDHDRIDHESTSDLAEAMIPIWSGNTVYDESVLMLSKAGAAPRGKLLFHPTRIVAVRDSGHHTTYVEGKDYVIEGNEIVATSGSKMTSMKDSDFPSGDYPWLSVAGKHTFVTYQHDELWTGPMQTGEGQRLHTAITKLKDRHLVTIVAYGDSITLGINVSGYRNEPPYLPTWPELAAGQLKRVYGYSRIKVYNAALGGMTSQWGVENAPDAVASLKPDLVLIAFGMNDFWSLTPLEYRRNVEGIMRAVRERSPDAEFILVSSIRFDPAYTKDPTYVGHMTSYREELRTLVGKGVALLDLTALSEFLYGAKNAKDILADPMHPDDFLSRIFAQELVQMLTPSSPRRTR